MSGACGGAGEGWRALSEPWLSGPIEGVGAHAAPLFYTFEQTRQELARHLEGLTPDQIWSRPHGMTPAGFHVRHIGGAVDRLSTYLKGGQLSPEQLDRLKRELELGATVAELLAALDADFEKCLDYARTIDPATLADPRYVGRKMLPTTVQGLVVHIAEHTQRHLGQAVTTVLLLRSIAKARLQ